MATSETMISDDAGMAVALLIDLMACSKTLMTRFLAQTLVIHVAYPLCCLQYL
jgi:hypothetical protein